MHPSIFLMVSAVCVLAATGATIAYLIQLRRWRVEVRTLQKRLMDLEAETTMAERSLRFERASARSYSAEVQDHIHKCRHDLASSLNVASGFLELMSQAHIAPGWEGDRHDQIKRALAALISAQETMRRLVAGVPDLRLNGDLARGTTNAAARVGEDAFGERNG